MKFVVSIAASAALGAAAAAPILPGTQDSQGSRVTPLAPVVDQEGGAVEGGAPLRPFLDGAAGSAQLDVAEPLAPDLEDSLRQRLTNSDLDLRMEAFQEAAEQAALSAGARRALEAIARDTADLDLAFSARLALREADRIGTWGRAGSAFGGQGFQVPGDPFEAMRRQMDSVFGADPFLDSVFKNDPFFQRGFGGSRGVFGADPFAGTDPVEAMRSRVERMREEMDAMRRGAARGGAPGGWASRSSSMTVERTEDGVRVNITEDLGEGPETRTYEAPSVEELLKAHPELEGRIR